MTQSDFISLAATGFSVGFGLGFMLWGFCYAIRLFRNSVAKALTTFDRF